MWSPALKIVSIKVGNRRTKLTKRSVDSAVPAECRYIIWDSQLAGFGVRVEPTGRKTFILRYRPKGDGPSPKRFMTIGRSGPVTPEQARNKATEILGAVATGGDPAAAPNESRAAATLAEAVAEFLCLHVHPKCKANTAVSYAHVLQRYIVPALGKHRLKHVTRADVANVHLSMRLTPAAANHAVAALSSLYSWAGRRGLIPEGCNPVRGLEKFREQRRERYLTAEELGRLGAALRDAEIIGIPYEIDEKRPTAKHAPKPERRRVLVAPDAIAAIRLLVLTGCRLREILHLRWEEVDLQRGLLIKIDSKTGRKIVVLGPPAVDILRSLPRSGAYVFPGVDGEKPRSDLKRPWALVTRHAGLTGLRIHDLRHSFAAAAAGAGLGLPIIGKLLGHTQASTTARYAHLADQPLRLASNAVAREIATAMATNISGVPSE